mmetsp:Transcript_32748/g.58736  ORF Transcript_32748/g.58736 Transcript_32748/m.58736 type:complete len:82 (+) Transcript_32748:1294-1539(+)
MPPLCFSASDCLMEMVNAKTQRTSCINYCVWYIYTAQQTVCATIITMAKKVVSGISADTFGWCSPQVCAHCRPTDFSSHRS